MTDSEINILAKSAMDWARGSWGQGQYDAPRFELETMVRLYKAIADHATKQAEEYEKMKKSS